VVRNVLSVQYRGRTAYDGHECQSRDHAMYSSYIPPEPASPCPIHKAETQHTTGEELDIPNLLRTAVLVKLLRKSLERVGWPTLRASIDQHWERHGSSTRRFQNSTHCLNGKMHESCVFFLQQSKLESGKKCHSGLRKVPLYS